MPKVCPDLCLDFEHKNINKGLKGTSLQARHEKTMTKSDLGSLYLSYHVDIMWISCDIDLKKHL